jgi:hypothetical protein
VISTLGPDFRVIEVKGRGAKGPVIVMERQLESFQACR